MPLWQHSTSGERVRTVPGSYEDKRLNGSDEWERVQPAVAPASEPINPGASTPAVPTAPQGGRRAPRP
ncbi:hypothetical protein JNW90_10585 [Micromonospora sp. STR1s_5]|nr:hypothetical protein [Micromonospora sp. STR1s_5]